MSHLLSRLLQARSFLLADGGTGTNLFAAGLRSGEPPELWNLAHPGRIGELHAAFLAAGSDIILTNSFGGNRFRLALHGDEGQMESINRAAARIARDAADRAGRAVVVAGSMGPTGELFAPLGTLDASTVTQAFAEQGRALAAGGADVLWIETMAAADELLAALAGAASTGLPVVCTMSFDTHGRTMMGLAPADLTRLCRDAHPRPVAFGANCGVGPADLVMSLVGMAGMARGGDVLVAKANAGIPEYVDGGMRYGAAPALMAAYACLARDAGARIIGGCCGAAPKHIRAMAEALAEHRPGAVPGLEAVEAALGGVSPGARAHHAGQEARPARGARRRRPGAG